MCGLGGFIIMNLKVAEETGVILEAFYEVYNQLGYGFIENVYQNALYKELRRRGIPCVPHQQITVHYKGEPVEYYETDIIAYNSVILELKAVSRLTEAHEIQLVNYLKATDIEVGLLLNFGPKPEFKRRFFSKEAREILKKKNPLNPHNPRLKNKDTNL